MTSPVPGHDVPTGDEPGAGSTPADEGEGPVDLSDRTDGGSPAANQTKVEPGPPTAAHPPPQGPPGAETLDAMNVGGADPQAPSHPAGGGRPQHPSPSVGHPTADDAEIASISPTSSSAGDAQGVPVASHGAAEGTSETTPRVQGVHTPQE